MNGILLVDKPKGWTSFDVVNKVRHVLRQAVLMESYKVASKKSDGTLDFQTFRLSTRLPKVKVGHTGTLDPLATGLLVLLVGTATKQATQLSKLDKTYEVTMKLGQTSTTGDDEGDKTVVSDTIPSSKAVLEALDGFRGHIMQTPPIYSAMKVNGQRAYKLARAGKEIIMEPRPATIFKIEMTGYTYPFVQFTADVSSGTYIRSLVSDIGNVLGTGAYMSDLRRTHIGPYTLANALTVTKETVAEQIADALHEVAQRP